MTFLRIQAPNFYLNNIQTWYESSFPIDERRSFADLAILLPCPDMHLCALVDNDQLVGFIIYWTWETTLFVEHFAIDPAQRGKQFGQQALTQLLASANEYVILEVELPNDELSQRRVRFYERQGFSLNPFDYVQPPYQHGKEPIPMRLMSIPAIPDQGEFDRFSQLIKKRVYERFYA
ncbi:GNAT family N-acetyltransferase [Spirosoma sp. KCTC 42546]|uniref:GNAT family N-acetyltransferase n=1 Tax=Spirosoma sp. KCTC 42546 TaxID=2520506 RepID=UPI0011577FDE|nr:GNAT family N-acetyltransferase [Spirosoma sp. KCTC 42546]QDK80027.1 GNAT family N-acetyltransferase [Spirosoma sp. KCTC 42546]